MRTILVIRHGHSTANEPGVPTAKTAEDLAFANQLAELTPRGENECAELAGVLFTEYGIDARSTRVAVSEFVRTKQTAKQLGFSESLTTPYFALNEVDHGMELGALRAMLRQNQIPRFAEQAAEAALRRAPTEDVWVTHGLLIAGLCTVLGTDHLYDRPVPRQCEVRRLTF